MSSAFLRLSLLASVLVVVAGCGGSSGGGPGTGGSGSGGSGSGGNPTTITFTITGATPIAVATKIGSGSFIAATLTSGALTLNLPSGTTNFAVAFVCPPVSLTSTNPQNLQTYQNIFEASTLDGTSFSESCQAAPITAGTTGTLTGSVDASAISGANYLTVEAENGGSSSTYAYLGSLSANFSFSAPAGTDRVTVLAYNDVESGEVETVNLVAAKNFSSQTVPGALNSGDTVVLGAPDQVTVEPLTYSNVPSGYSDPRTAVSYQMVGGGALLLVANAATTGYPTLPVGAVESGDYYFFDAGAGSASNSSEGVSVATISASAGPESFAFPPAWSYAGPTPEASPSFDLSYSGFSGLTGVRDGVSIYWTAGSTPAYIVEVIPTGNYLNGTTTVAIPNLSGVTGFLSPPASGTKVQWSANLSQGNFPALQPLPLDGTIVTVFNSGSYVVP